MENENNKGELGILHAFLLALAMFGLNCLILSQITDSFAEVTRTAGAGVAMSFIIWLFTHGFTEENENYTMKVHFIVINIVMILLSLKVKYSVW